MAFYFLLFLIIFIIVMSLRTLFLPSALQEKYISWQSFVYLLFIYSTLFIGFGLIYFLLMQIGLEVLIENGQKIDSRKLYELQSSLYFSGVTLFSIGYGDLSPVGYGRFIAIMEGMIGYTIPASFVVRTVIDFRKDQT
ncbi:potassium channel family protein [Fervidibacillus halotolerans]|uniref:Potassium channel family protein n=1 Tax=Fervidibacillus halotolerans TaxID=2980027 RepID=A0A9E8LZZ5_9BACI|nr:potassium channel family protein [Fervidibacillus halotolerans]WAA12938.1 potassium channel family protein [Fervidibacillus halotolerans]